MAEIRTVKFSHKYDKMPELILKTRLIQVLKTNKSELSPEFIEYDARHQNGLYPIPDGDLLVLFLLSDTPETRQLWTTVRSWTPDKERYYRGLTGQYLRIETPDNVY